MGWLGIILVIIGILFLAFIVVNMNDPSSSSATESDSSPSAVTPAPNRSASTPQESQVDTGALLSGLPAIYYVLAIFCGAVLVVFTIANADELNSTQIGAWIGYTVGAVLSMLTVGRVIELLQQIRDAVRS